MTTILKENFDPGVYIPFQMKYLNRETYNKYLTYIASKQNSIWNIKIKSMSVGSFFKLEEIISETYKLIMSFTSQRNTNTRFLQHNKPLLQTK
jgi:hypothetical protein